MSFLLQSLFHYNYYLQICNTVDSDPRQAVNSRPLCAAQRFHSQDFVPARFFQRPEIRERDNQPPVRSHPRHSLSFPPTLCLFALRRTLQLARLLKDKAVEAQACYSLGNTYTLLQDYERAIDYHLKHLVIAQDLNDRYRPLGDFSFHSTAS